MNFTDFASIFSTLEICEVVDEFRYSSTKVKDAKGPVLMKVMVQYPGRYTFTVCQKDSRCFKRDLGY